MIQRIQNVFGRTLRRSPIGLSATDAWISVVVGDGGTLSPNVPWLRAVGDSAPLFFQTQTPSISNRGLVFLVNLNLLLLLDDLRSSNHIGPVCCLLFVLLRQPQPSLCHVDQSGPFHEPLFSKRQGARNL